MHALFAWCLAHPEVALPAALAFLVALWKRLPPATRADLERRYPRAVAAIRVGYALFPDVIKALYAARVVVSGPPALTPPGDRVTEVPLE